jgi:hypothetical protein
MHLNVMFVNNKKEKMMINVSKLFVCVNDMKIHVQH